MTKKNLMMEMGNGHEDSVTFRSSALVLKHFVPYEVAFGDD